MYVKITWIVFKTINLIIKIYISLILETINLFFFTGLVFETTTDNVNFVYKFVIGINVFQITIIAVAGCPAIDILRAPAVQYTRAPKAFIAWAYLCCDLLDLLQMFTIRR